MRIGRLVGRQGAALFLGVSTEEITRLVRAKRLKPVRRRPTMTFDLGDLVSLRKSETSQAVQELMRALRT